jgi:predicted permease
LRATRVDLALVMKETSRSVTGGRNLLGKVLLVTQVALSLVLLIGAGLFLRTLNNLRSVDVGFNPQNLLMFSINPALNRYDADRSAALYRELQTVLAAVPGVRNVAITRVALLSGSRSTSSYHVQGGKPGPTNVHMMSVTPEFFETMQIPVVLGRGFTDRDDRAAPKVAIVNETAARALFPDGATLGRRIGGSVENNGEFEVVGVIRDTRYSSLREPAPPTLYQAMWQQPARAVTVMLRTATDPSSLVETVRAAVRKVDTNLPITNVATQMEQLDRRVAQDRLYANAFSLFGALALVLASIGLFGVMSYMVARRTNEIGVRMALGANRLDVARMVLRETLVLVGAGVAVGLGAALLAGRYVAEKLYAVPPRDVATMSTAVAVIVGVGLLAGFLPARRASRVDPMVALRTE